MARSSERKTQFKTTIPKGLLDRMHNRYLDDGWEKSLQVLAGLLVFESLGDQARREAIRMATRAAQVEGGLELVLETVADPRNQAASEKALRATVRRLLARIDTVEEARRPA